MIGLTVKSNLKFELLSIKKIYQLSLWNAKNCNPVEPTLKIFDRTLSIRSRFIKWQIFCNCNPKGQKQSPAKATATRPTRTQQQSSLVFTKKRGKRRRRTRRKRGEEGLPCQQQQPRLLSLCEANFYAIWPRKTYDKWTFRVVKMA